MTAVVSIFGYMIKNKAGEWAIKNDDGKFVVDCRGVPQNFLEGDYVHITGALEGYYSRNLLPVIRIKPDAIMVTPL
jgi:hypothetical protein